jgi:hypothetical protein
MADNSKPKYIPPSIKKLMEKKPSVASLPSISSPSPSTISPAMARILERRERLGLSSAVPSASLPINTPKPSYNKDKTNELIRLSQDIGASDTELIKLITEGANPYGEIRDDGKWSYTPFSYVVKYNKLPTVEYIISHDVHSKVTLLNKLTPLHEAIETKNIPAIKLLLDKFYPSMASDFVGYLPAISVIKTRLFISVIDTKDIDIVDLFFNSDTPVRIFNNDVDFYMRTTVPKKFPEAVLYFLNKGANPNYVPRSSTKTPLELAIEAQLLDTAKILLEKGAIIPSVVRNRLSTTNSSSSNSRFLSDLINIIGPYLSRQEEFPIPAATIISNNRSVPRELKTFEITEEGGMPILTIPQGSLLYNSFYVGDIRSSVTGKLNLNAILHTLGGILPFATTVKETATGLKISSCIDKFSQKFFYTNPVGGAALKQIHADKAFNVTSAFQTKRDMRFALLMDPGPFHRLGESHAGIVDRPHADLYPCSLSDAESCECAKLIDTPNTTPADKERIRRGEKCKFGFNYDACIRPKFLKEHNLDGHIAIAEADSYESLLKYFQREVNGMSIDKKYKSITNFIFDSCLSTDTRDTGSKKIRGFPELVIQIFGTDWYEGKNSIQFEYEIPLGEDKSEEAKVNALVRFLIGFNALPEPTADIPVQSPLQLIRTSTYTRWYNLETGLSKDTTPSGNNIKPENVYIQYYLNSLDAFENGDLRFIVDTRTGFLVRPDFLPPVKFVEGSDDSIYSYEDICIGTSTIGITDFEKSCLSRMMNKSDWSFVWDTDKAVHMLEYAASDYEKYEYNEYNGYNGYNENNHGDMNGGAPIQSRRIPNSIKRHARPGRINNKTKNRNMRTYTRTRALTQTRKNKKINTKTITSVDDIYNAYMNEIRKEKLAYEMAVKKGGNKKSKRGNNWRTHKNIRRRRSTTM